MSNGFINLLLHEQLSNKFSRPSTGTSLSEGRFSRGKCCTSTNHSKIEDQNQYNEEVKEKTHKMMLDKSDRCRSNPLL